jgi:hypothetical protein
MSEIETKAPTEAAPEETPAEVVRRHIRAALEALTRCPESTIAAGVEQRLRLAHVDVNALIKAGA